jgi:hypothetical protein
VKGPRVEQPRDALAHRQFAAVVLTLDVVLAAHLFGELDAALDFVEFRLPRHIFLPLLLRFLVAQASACVLTMFQTHPQP